MKTKERRRKMTVDNKDAQKLDNIFEKERKRLKPMTIEEEYRNADVPMPKGTHDLEEIIRTLETRNEYLHKHIEKITNEIQEIRKDNKHLAQQYDDQLRQFRNKGLI
jgi:uncharacterized protein YydD (DUF2326 family)